MGSKQRQHSAEPAEAESRMQAPQAANTQYAWQQPLHSLPCTIHTMNKWHTCVSLACPSAELCAGAAAGWKGEGPGVARLSSRVPAGTPSPGWPLGRSEKGEGPGSLALSSWVLSWRGWAAAGPASRGRGSICGWLRLVWERALATASKGDWTSMASSPAIAELPWSRLSRGGGSWNLGEGCSACRRGVITWGFELAPQSGAGESNCCHFPVPAVKGKLGQRQPLPWQQGSMIVL